MQYSIEYRPIIANSFVPRSRAAMVEGSIEAARAIAERSRMPNSLARDRFELERRAELVLGEQLGGPDYVLIGEVAGGGDDQLSLAALKSALARRAADEGGDVVLVYDSGLREDSDSAARAPAAPSRGARPTADRRGTRGISPTETAWPTAQAAAGPQPGRMPYAAGMVFRLTPGYDARRARMESLSDMALESLLTRLDQLWQSPELSYEETYSRWGQLMTRMHGVPDDASTESRTRAAGRAPSPRDDEQDARTPTDERAARPRSREDPDPRFPPPPPEPVDDESTVAPPEQAPPRTTAARRPAAPTRSPRVRPGRPQPPPEPPATQPAPEEPAPPIEPPWREPPN
ncbi:MAG: hypothetical protein U1D55_16040 [Phycisphaerae bacterium]